MNKIYEKLIKDGYCHVSYKHHPKKIKDSIKFARFRPMAKQCFSNSQKLVTRQNIYNLYYAEGIVTGGIIPFEHAWVIDEKENHYDITLDPMPKILCYKKYDKSVVIENMRKTMSYTGINWPWLEVMKMALLMGVSIDCDEKEIYKKVNEQFSFLKKINERID